MRRVSPSSNPLSLSLAGHQVPNPSPNPNNQVPRRRDKTADRGKPAGARSVRGAVAPGGGSTDSPLARRPPSSAVGGGSLSPTKRSSSRDLTAAPANGACSVQAGSPAVRRKSRPEPASSGGGSGGGGGSGCGAGGMEGGAEAGGFERDGRFPGAETPLAPATTTAAPSRVLSTEALHSPPAIDRLRRPAPDRSEAKPPAAPERAEARPATAAATVPDRTEAKAPATATEPPAAAAASSAPASKAASASSLLKRGFSKKAAPAAKALPPGSEIRVAAASAKAASGFRVAVKASHPSPRPFAANDLTFD